MIAGLYEKRSLSDRAAVTHWNSLNMVTFKGFCISAVAGLKLLGGPNLHFYCSTLVFNIYFLEFAKLLGGPGPPRPLPTLRHCVLRLYDKLGYFLLIQ